jgi:group I intron endonuclease
MINGKIYKDVKAVYKITQSDGRYYIGSSTNLYTRIRSHKTFIKKNQSRLTDDWEKLEIEIIEEFVDITVKDIKKKEDYYLSLYWSDKILNIEKKSTGRSISGDKNPMRSKDIASKVSEKLRLRKGPNNSNWKGGLTQTKITCPTCNGRKHRESVVCRECKKINKKL